MSNPIGWKDDQFLLPIGGGNTSPAVPSSDSRLTNARTPTSHAASHTTGSDLIGLTPTAVKTSAYNAAVNDFVVCNLSGGSFAVTLPATPTDKARIAVSVNIVGAGNSVEVKTSGSDVISRAGGPTSLYMRLNSEISIFQYQASTAIWYEVRSANPYNFASNFPGIDAFTPITNADISIDTSTRVLSITTSRGYFNIFTDGGGMITRYRKTGTISFPAFTDTSGTWFFYFDVSGNAVTTQTAWTTADFSTICPVYRIVWNSSLVGAAKLVAEYIEYHPNDIPADTHEWMHLNGAIWASGGTMVNNALSSGSPNADGRNSVIALTTVRNIDDNLEYTITNSTGGSAWQQDLGNTTAASLNATNSALFKVFTQDSSARLSFLSATRFPFPWNSGTNIPFFITTTGTQTPVTNNRFFVVFVYSTQNPRTGEPLKVITATSDFTSLTNARAFNWVDIQNAYSIIANDNEIRVMYRLIFEHRTTYDAGAKYAVLRETQDLRKTAVSTATSLSGSIPASSVVVTPNAAMTATNAQAALEAKPDLIISTSDPSGTYPVGTMWGKVAV